LNENDGNYIFKDFIRDDKAMARLFEAFIRNFYKRELSGYKVYSPKITWYADAIGDSDLNLLPEMRTDIVLETINRKIVLDTKYYRDITTEYFGSKTFHSNNLYQVYSYLRNLEDDNTDIRNANSEGLLLYPTVGNDYDQSFMISGHKVRFATIDLSKDWKDIDTRLRYLIQ
jgi:5-methylcytosine-specific restriction enzyme subunit McrC